MNRAIMRLILFVLILVFTSQVMGQFPEGTPWLKRPFPVNNEKFTFAILGDKTTGGENNWPIFDRAVDEINHLRPDFVIMVGDLIQGYVADKNHVELMWQEFMTHAERLQVPFFVLPGNHDISNEMMYDFWTKNVGPPYYSFVYNKSLFLLLNSEEYKKTKAGQFGEKQLQFIKNKIGKNSRVNHMFLFMHKPTWSPNEGESSLTEEWKTVIPWLKGRKATVFAGHRHRLLYKTIDGHRHILHSATGGKLAPKEMAELGNFHHFSLVTVEPDTAVIAIIKPGHIFPGDIARPDFIDKANSTISAKSAVDVDQAENKIRATIVFKFTNPFNRLLQAKFRIDIAEKSDWVFDKLQRFVELEAGTSAEISFSGKSKIDSSMPFPEARFDVSLGRDVVNEGVVQFYPGEEAGWHSPAEVLVLGAVDMGIKRKPTVNNGLLKSAKMLVQPWGPEIDFNIQKTQMTAEGLKKWQRLKVTEGKIDFDQYFRDRDYSVGFAHFTIESPKDKFVLASVRPDNFCQVYLNGEVVLTGQALRGVPAVPYIFLLQLKKGNNEILLKMADYTGSWYSNFAVIDPGKDLQFKTQW
ncbi:MAG: hypothetical protein DWQ05_17805 [Calditrichaeota bacterium]|nr:MAG: hypothetical protein DWQ05_17805 [Calditrichota bacterium]